MALPNNEETLIYRIVVESEEALADVQAFRADIDRMKENIKRIAAETGQSFRVVADSLRITFSQEQKLRIVEIRDEMSRLTSEIKKQADTIRGTPAPGTDVARVRSDIRALNADLTTQKSKLAEARAEGQIFGKVMTASMRELNTSTKETTKGIEVMGIRIRSLGDIAKLVFVALFGGSILSILARFSQFLGEAVQKGYDLSKAFFQLEIGVRALRRAGIDITTKEILDNLNQINDGLGNLFSKLELVEGAAQFTNLIRDLGFTKQQIFELQGAVATLAVVNGRAMDDVQRTVALALSSGYTEGLQRLGVSINRLTIAEKAMELGFEGGYNSLNEQERAFATQVLILEKAAKYADDLAEAQKTLFGDINKTTAANQDLSAEIGDNLLPAKRAWQEIINSTLTLIVALTAALGPFIGAISDTWHALEQLQFTFNANDFWTQAEKYVQDMTKAVFRLANSFHVLTTGENLPNLEKLLGGPEELDKFFGDNPFSVQVDVEEGDNFDKIFDTLEEYASEIENLEEDVAEKRRKINEDLQQDLSEIERDGARDRAKILRDYESDIDQIERKYARRRSELYRDLQQKLSDIGNKLDFNISEAQIKYQQDVADAWVKYYNEIANAGEKHRQKELERERKFNEELLRLREDYLLDLEDALMERDAKAVLRAVRKYNLDKERARRENELGKTSDKERYEQELKDIEQRKNERLASLRRELDERLRILEVQAQREREQAQRKYEQDLEDLRRKQAAEEYERLIRRLEQEQEQKLRETQETQDRLGRYEREKEDLKKFEDEKLAIIGEALAEQANLMQISAEKMYDIIQKFFGEGGLALKVFEAYANSVRQLQQSMGGASIYPPNYTPRYTPQDQTYQQIPTYEFARGGILTANKPTLALMGEGGQREVGLFAAENKMGQLLANFAGKQGVDVGGKASVLVTLSPDLQGRIIEDTMGKVANVMLEVQRR